MSTIYINIKLQRYWERVNEMFSKEFARMRSKACLNYLQCSNTKMWCSACHMTATATSHGRVVCGRCLDPAAPATIAPWSTLIRIPSCRPEPRVIFIPSPSAEHKLTKGVNEISRWFPQHSTWYWDAVFMPVYIIGLFCSEYCENLCNQFYS